MPDQSKIITVRLPAANAHLMTNGRRRVLIDSGTPAAVPRLRRALLALGVEPRSLDAVVLTHGHADHAGGARGLVGLDVPVVLGAADVDMVRAGQNPPLTPTNVTARMIKPFVDRPFPPYEPDLLVASRLELSRFGVDACAIVVGGHTAGSLVVVEDRPGGDLVVGDLLRGGHLGGSIAPDRPLPHYYSTDTGRDLRLAHDLIREHRPQRLLLGHGGPVRADDVLRLAAAA